ncbi:MAG: patatin-like phospholipase family protein [Spongiibacteraceae bacterium]|nr:patatin-like phospholipase family protein [Spongiibacteraceae bacterium]
MSDSNQSISLVLGSGGARGLAHIGVIHWLEENNYTIDSIAGSSIGALVGAMYALGKLSEFSDWIRAITKLEMIRLMDFSLGQGGLVKGDKIINVLKEITGEKLIEELPIHFTAVATDLVNEKEVWINRGPVFDAIRASISMPLFFTPFDFNGLQLIDGGILNPVPIAPTFKDLTDKTIAVNLAGSPNNNLNLPEDKPEVPVEKSIFNRKIDQFIDSIKPAKTEKTFNGMYDIISQSIDAMQGAVARQKLAAYPPDIVLELPRNLCSTLDFHRADEMIAAGYELAKTQLSH